jgi:alpha-beta hydrolase superfamily lysophospholipase
MVAVPLARRAWRDTRRFTASEHSFAAADGTTVFYRAWRPSTPASRILVLFHRGHEHSGRWDDIVDAIAPDGFAVFAWDARGNGRSQGPRDDAESFGCYAHDAERFVRHLSSAEGVPLEQFAVVGHSVGAVIAAAWIHDYAPRLRAAVFATPAFRIRLYLPLAIPALRLARRLRILRVVPSYVKARVLTHDRAQQIRHQQDRLISHAISSRILIDLHDTATRLVRDAAAVRVPALVLVAGADWVVKPSAQKQFFERLGSSIKRLEMLPGYYHDVYHEADAARPIRLTREFIAAAFDRPVESTPLVDADARGHTRDEYRALSEPLRPLSPKWFAYGAFGLFLRTLGRASDGIRLGWQSGFNSGRTLDYVYRNQPAGITPIGRFIDRQYLNGIGWRGIRARRRLLERAVLQAIETHANPPACANTGSAHANTGTVHLMDVAAGAGRYLLETLTQCDRLDVDADLRDIDSANLLEGESIARTLGLVNVRFVKADAFDPTALDGCSPRPHIAVVSGLYELFPDNRMVLRSLEGLARAVRAGGTLIYTNQPWHPQLELIARGLCNRDGTPWVMRRRTQAEMDDLVRAAGFEKVQTEIDRWGMFTVSIARRAA